MAYDSWNINDKINGIQFLAILALYPMQNKCITTNYIMFIDTNIYWDHDIFNIYWIDKHNGAKYLILMEIK